MRFVSLLLAVCAHAWAEPSAQDDCFRRLPAAASVLPQNAVASFRIGGSGEHGGSVKVIPVSGPGFDHALRITTDGPAQNSWDVQAVASNIAPVEAGDALLAVFWAHAVDPLPTSGEARTEVVFDSAGGLYTKSLRAPISLDLQWRKFYIPFQAAESYSPGRARFKFRAGFDPQTIEIADLQLLNYHGQISARSLPHTEEESYPGRDPKAPWRDAAARRIETLRKGNLKITVTENGQPVPNANVHVIMKRHAFAFGSAVEAARLLEQSPDGEHYREVIAANYNKVTIGDDLKWSQWETNRASALRAVAWLRERGIAVRGYCLVWPSWPNLPSRLKSLSGRPKELRQAVLDHVREEAAALAGELVEWDVINEPYTAADLQRILGDRFLADCFTAAGEADPTVKLDINDCPIPNSDAQDMSHQTAYEKTIRELLSAGSPLGGIGLETHIGRDFTSPERLLSLLNRLAKLGLPIQATEHDVNAWDEALQADYTRDYLTIMFSHPAVIGVLTRGFWEGAHSTPNAAYYRKDWTLRPAGQVWQDLVHRQWWTDVETRTDENGGCTVRGFRGDYAIAVAAEGKTATVTASMRENTEAVTIALPR